MRLTYLKKEKVSQLQLHIFFKWYKPGVHILPRYSLNHRPFCLCHQNGFRLVTRGSDWHTWPFSSSLWIRSLKESSDDCWIQVTLSSLFHMCTRWHETIPKPPGPSPIYSICSNMNVFMVAQFSSQMHCIDTYPELWEKKSCLLQQGLASSVVVLGKN